MNGKSHASDASLKKKLLETSTFKSLQIERDIASKLLALGWEVTNGVFYSDPKEKKPREIDVVGSQFLEKKSDWGKQLLRLYLIIECKSIKGFHILISPQLQPTYPVIAHHHWLGYETQGSSRLFSRLEELRFKREQTTNLKKKLAKIAYPHGVSRSGDLRIEPPDAKVQASAFRETNIASEKQLDNSVLWRATQSLRSAVKSFMDNSYEVDMEYVFFTAEGSGTSKQRSIKEIIYWFTDRVNQIDIWHPIVVLDCLLWAVKNDAIEPVDWFRLDLINLGRYRDWWCDVVTRSSFDSYIRNLTEYYARNLKSAGAKPFEI
jgi:hypothetical protein